MSKYPKEDTWILFDKDINSQNFGKSFIFNFECFASEEIKIVIKEYIWSNYITGNRVLKGLTESFRGFKIFNKFCFEYGIDSFKELDNNILDKYRTFLKLYTSPFTKETISYSYQRNCFSSLKTLIGWCHVYMPKSVPQRQIFTGGEYKQNYNNIKIEFIPDEILKIINSSLKNEENLYLKYGMEILKTTGMRIADLLLLKTNCISEHPISGVTISWYDHKNRKSMDNLPVPMKCKLAIDELLSITSRLRMWTAEKDKNNLFIYQPKSGRNTTLIVTVSKQVFTKWCSEFCSNHNIFDVDGKPFKMTSHMFRRTLATDMFSKGTNIKAIQEALGHASPTTTRKYYADIKDDSCLDMFLKIGILGNLNELTDEDFNSSYDKKWFHENCNSKARLGDGYCTLPIKDGNPCGRYLSQQKCYVCSRYITTIDDLETHRKHLEELQSMLNFNIYGEHFASHIIPTVTVLKEIIRRLESLKYEC